MSATVRQRLLAVSLLVGLAAGTHAETNPSGALPDVERPVAAYEQRRLTVIRARSVEADADADAVTRVGGEVQFRLQTIGAVRAELTEEQIDALQRDVRVIRVTIDRGTHVAA